MKQVLLLTTIGLLFFGGIVEAQPNIFNPADPITPYNSASPPATNWNNIQKWVVTNRSLGWNTSSYKSYHFNGISFRLKFPKTYQHNVADGKKYPVMIFWHGAGEKGTIYDNELQLLHGGQQFRDWVDNGSFDGFLLYPQNTNGFFGNTYYGPMLQVVDSLAKYCKLDIDRVLVNGLSAGGSAAFDILAGYPQRIAKATPSAAAATGLIPYISSFIHIPIWFATGGLDTNPSPFMAQMLNDSLQKYGADVRWTLYPNQGHFVWGTHWQEPDFLPYMNDLHKANPLVYFQRNLFCPDSPTAAKMGLTAGFFAYEWQINTGSGYTTIAGATANEYTATAYGTYRVRFKRTSTSDWSDWSPKPVTVGPKTTTVTPALTVMGMRSKVLPAPDGSTTVPLKLPKGFAGYEFWRVSDNVIVGTDSIYEAAPGVFKGRVKEQFGCNAFFSPDFTVISANGPNKPDAAKNLVAFSNTQSSIQLDWSDNPNPAFNETGFEIYRGTQAGGPYKLINITAANVLSYLDANLPSNTTYFYIVRAVNNTAAATVSNEATAKTKVDNTPPTAPGNLRTTLAGRFSVSLEWDASTDDGGVVSKYDIYVNNVKLFTTDQTKFIVNELDSFQRYTFAVRAKDPTGNQSAPSNQINVTTKLQGLFYEYYHGSFTQLPDFNVLSPVIKSGVSATTDISVRTQNDNFAMIWQGYIKIPTTATYTFETCSDDGSKLYVNMPYSNDATATVSNDFLHGTNCVTNTIALVAGQVYPITATYFEATGTGETMQLWWRNNAGLSRQQIPSTQFADTFTPSGSAPATPTSPAATATAFDRINITWTDASNNETGFEIVRATAAAGPFVNVGTTAAGATSFLDSGRNASTQYWYKIRAIGLTGESAFTATVNATTQALPPAPTAPTVLAATVVSSSRINLQWNDNSNNETAFEIYRSTNNNSNFRLITTIAGGIGSTKTYFDLGLFANVRYYYKVRAVGTGGPSAYSNEVNGKTLNTQPDIDDVLDFTIRHSVQFELPLTAKDLDGDALTFSSTDLPYFANIVNGSNGTAKIVFNPGFGDQGGYSFTVTVSDGNGGEDITYLNLLVNGNFPPTLNPINDIVVEEGSVTNVSITASDVENTAFLGWTFYDKPSFASFSHNGAGNGTLNLQPGYAHAGVYTVTLLLDDGFGAWVSRTFKITVTEKDPNEKILVSLRTATSAPAPWNNMSSQSISNLKNTLDQTTTVGANVVNSWQFNQADVGAQTGNNSGVYPDAVMKDNIHWGYFLGNNSVDTSELRITGLNPARKYTLVFFGSTTYNLFADNGTTTYKVGAQSASLAVQNNTANKVSLYDISPNGSGVISVSMIGDPNVNIGGWLNAFEIINQYDDGTKPVKAIDLTGQFIEHTGTRLNWTDVAYNELRYKVYRATTLAGPYTLLNPGAMNGNATSYTDATAVPVTQYYYYVVANNSVGDSNPSDTISVLTGNNSPLINGLEDIFVKTESTVNEPFTVTDNAGDVVTVTADLPPFVTLEALGGTSYRLVAAPGTQYVGLYAATIIAKDNKGGTTTKQITVQAADKRTRSFYVNFGVENRPGGAPWNDFLGFTYAGKQLLQLKDEAGVVTGLSIKSEDNWSNIYDLGMITGNNSGSYPDSVLRSGIYYDQSSGRRFTFGGLDPAKRYNVVFIGSSNDGVTAAADYSHSSGQTASLNARYNTNRTAQLNGLAPLANGTLQVTATKQASSTIMYLNGIVLEEYTDTIPVLNPIRLYAEPSGKTSLTLYWAERANNENGYEVYRATSAAGPWTLVTTTSSNVTTYINNSGLTANTRYFYRVRARRNTGPTFSQYSNVAETITPKSISYVNLTFTYPQGSPWNDFNANPDVNKNIVDIKNDVNASTGLTITITQPFNGQYEAGMQTGSGIYPDNVMRSNYWLDRTQLGQFKVTGLNHSKRYRFGFFGSAGPGWDDVYTSTYTIGNRTVYLNAHRNDSKTVYIGDVIPDENGEVLLNISTTATANFGFTAAIIIQSYDDAVGETVLNRANMSDEVTEDKITVADAAGKVQQAVTEPDELKNIRILAYPNPFTDNLKIDFYNNSAANVVSVDIVDMTGRLMMRKDAGKVPMGMNTMRIDVGSSLTPGMYIVRLNINGKVVNTSKLVKSGK